MSLTMPAPPIPRFARLAFSLIALGTSGCFTLSDSTIGESTAPSSVKASQHPTISGRHRIIVTYREINSTDLGALYAAAYAQAQKTCPGYAELNVTDRTGAEATSSMMGINGPWVEMNIQCPNVTTATIRGPGVAVVEKYSKGLPDAAFFDIHAETYPADYDRMFDTVMRVLNDQGDPAYRPDKALGLIQTGRVRHGAIGFPIYEQYVVAITRETATTTKVTFRLFVHNPQFDQSGAAAFTPVERAYVYRRAAAFVDRLRIRLRR